MEENQVKAVEKIGSFSLRSKKRSKSIKEASAKKKNDQSTTFSSSDNKVLKKPDEKFSSRNIDTIGKDPEHFKSKSTFKNLDKIKKITSVTSIVDSLIPASSTLNNRINLDNINISKGYLEKLTAKLNRLKDLELPMIVRSNELNTSCLNEKLLETNNDLFQGTQQVKFLKNFFLKKKCYYLIRILF